MILQLLRLDLSLVGEIGLYQSFQFERSYSGIGKFTLHIDPNAPGANLIERDMLLMPVGRSSHCGIVQDIEQGQDKLVVRGVQLKGLVQRRICVPPLNLPKKIWKYTQGEWVLIQDKEVIKALLTEGVALQGYEKPETVTEGLLWVDMQDLATVYNWERESRIGEVWLDLERAQVRDKYRNFGYDRITADAETALLHYIENNITDPEDEGRRMSEVMLAENRHRGAVYPWQARFEKLEDILKNISEVTETGWTIEPDLGLGKLVVKCFAGRNFTELDSAQYVVISVDYGNAGDVRYKEQSSQSSNVAYVGGTGEDENRMILAISPKGEALAEGILRRECWTEAGSTDDPVMARLAGEKKLAESAIKQSLTAEVLPFGAMKYGLDWDLGDVVLVELLTGGKKIQTKARITNIVETVEVDKAIGLSVTFGDSAITIQDKINQAGRVEAIR